MQLTLTEKTEIKNLDPATPALVISQLSSSRKQTYMRTYKPAMYAKHKWLGGCAENNTLFCFLCLLLVKDTTSTQTGVTALNHLDGKVKKNEDSVKHLRT